MRKCWAAPDLLKEMVRNVMEAPDLMNPESEDIIKEREDIAAFGRATLRSVDQGLADDALPRWREVLLQGADLGIKITERLELDYDHEDKPIKDVMVAAIQKYRETR